MADRPTLAQHALVLQTYKDQLTATGKVDHAQVASATDLPLAVVRQAWSKGWSDQPPALLPIRDIIERARIAARARVAKAQRQMLRAEAAETRDAAQDIASQIAVETFASRQGLIAAQGLLSSAAQLIHATSPVRERIIQDIADVAADPDQPLAKLLRIMREVGEFSQTAMAVFKQYAEVNGKLLGKPDVKVAHEHEVKVPQGAEAIQELRRMVDVFRRFTPPGTVPLLEPPPPVQVIDVGVPETAEAVTDEEPPSDA